MLDFWQSQLDYVLFICGLMFVLLIPVGCILNRHLKRPELPWSWLGLFGMAHGAGEWLHMLALDLGRKHDFDVARILLSNLSFLCLLEFSRRSTIITLHRGPGWLFTVVLVATSMLGGMAGPSGLLPSAGNMLGLVAGLWAAAIMFHVSSLLNYGDRYLRTAGTGMVGYALAVGMVVPQSSFFPVSILDYDSFFANFGFPIQFIHALFAVVICVSLWLFALASPEDEEDRRTQFLRRCGMFVTLGVMILVVILGATITDHLGSSAFRQACSKNGRYMGQFRQILSGKIRDAESVVRVMAGSPGVVSALISKSAQTNQLANAVMDRYCGPFPSSVCYIMDAGGITVSSSNRNIPGSFVGNNYAFRPYFQEAAAGCPGLYFALGVTSKERGLYSSYPVHSTDGSIIGVAVVKRSIEMLESMVDWNSATLLVDPHGIVFLSSKSDMALKSLWPVPEEATRALIGSQQFGNGPFPSIFSKELIDGTSYKLNDKNFLVNREPAPLKGWSLVSLSSLHSVALSRLYGIGSTMVMCFGLILLVVFWDFTLKATARIAASERLFRGLAEGNPNCVSLFDREARYLAINDNGLNAMGRNESYIVGRRFPEVWSRESRPAAEEAVRGVLEGRKTAFEGTTLREDGRHVAWSVVLNPIIESDQTVKRFVGIAIDITEQNEKDKRLQDLGEEYGAIIEAFDGLIYICSHEYQIEFANVRLIERTGHSPIGEKCYKVLHNLDQVCPWCVSRRVIEGETVPCELLSPRDNRWHYAVYAPVLRSNGSLSKMAMVLDITERKLAEISLEKSEKEYRNLVNTLPAVVFKGYSDWSIDLCDDKIEALTGYKRADFEFRKIRWSDMIVEDDFEDVKRVMNRAMKENHQYEREYRIRNKEGKIIWIHERGKIIVDEAGAIDHVSGVIIDISDRKQLENQLIQSQKMEAVGRLAGGVAHDFNNILTAIIGYSDIILNRMDDYKGFRKDVEQIKRAGERAASLTNHLLAFSRKQVQQQKVLDLNLVIADIELMLRRLIGEDIDLVTSAAPSLGRVVADASQIEQVILNLAINARDAMPMGGMLTIETSNVELNEVYAQRHVDVHPGRYVLLAVSDSGCGMDNETLGRIFEPFFTTKEAGKGTGLGLATVYGIIKQSGGHIWVYSEIGRGTTFKIYLPLADENEAFHEHRTSQSDEIKKGSETILLVEDDDVVRELVSETLRMHGYYVLEAPLGSEALRICEKHTGKLALMVTDVVMPGMSGCELAKRMETTRPDMKVLFMSGYTDKAIVHRGVLDRGTAFLQKPFTPNALAYKVREVLDQPTPAKA